MALGISDDSFANMVAIDVEDRAFNPDSVSTVSVLRTSWDCVMLFNGDRCILEYVCLKILGIPAVGSFIMKRTISQFVTNWSSRLISVTSHIHCSQRTLFSPALALASKAQTLLARALISRSVGPTHWSASRS